MLQSQLFGFALHLCKSFLEEEIDSENGADVIVKAVNKRDRLDVKKEVYGELITMVTIIPGEEETFAYFESRFPTQV